MKNQYLDDYAKRFSAKKRKTRTLRRGELEEIQHLIKNYYANLHPDLPLNTSEANYVVLADDINEQYTNLGLTARFICDIYNNINTNKEKNHAKLEAIKKHIRQVLHTSNAAGYKPEEERNKDVVIEESEQPVFRANAPFENSKKAYEGKKFSRLQYQYWINAATKTSDLSKKIDIYHEALLEFPDHEKLLQNLAVYYTDAGRYEEAEQCELRSIELYPNNPDLHSNYAVHLHRMGRDYDIAEQHFKRAIELQPEHINNNGHYGYFLQRIRKDYAAAEKQYQIALKLNHENEVVLLNYGTLLCFHKFNPKAGIAYLEKANQIMPNDHVTLGNLASAFTVYEMDLSLAEKYFEAAIERDPTNPIKHTNQAQLLFAIGKKKEGLKAIELATKYARGDFELLIETEFYLYTHCPEVMAKAKKNIQSLLNKGVTDLDKNFTINIKAAIKNGHPDIKTLIKFAEQISGLKYDKNGQAILPVVK